MTMMRWRWTVVGAGIGLYVVGVGFLGGLAAERLRFDQGRGDLLSRFYDAVARLRAVEGPAPATEGRPWTAALRGATDALARMDVRAAERRVHEAHAAAAADRSWEGLLGVGDAHRGIGEVSGRRAEAEAKAREAYLAALFRARQQGSLDGVLRATEAFAALGDRDAADLGLRIATALAARDPEALADVRAVAARLAHHSGSAGDDD
ncbi:MAG TPA: hypothetical protein VGX21_01300 [Methylomirabilota bacterium]|jgi:hypothetical protein|nr:hypothetical protein [Methylomirabilota bacterium]